jgi:NAD(P)-dependent dehydrogenase (short-subunit alcohol dehydrogenase family)
MIIETSDNGRATKPTTVANKWGADMGRLDERVVIVTGGSRGLGEAISRLFAREGARVIITDILDDAGEEVAKDLSAGGLTATFHHLDVRNADEWSALIPTLEAEFGRVDGLVNNAAVLGGGPIETCTLEAWDRVIAVNQTGTFLGMKYCLPAFLRHGAGSIVNVSSSAGIVPFPGTGPSYAATKAAVRVMTKSIAVDYATRNIRANSLHPGRFQTQMSVDVGSGISDAVVDATPMRRAANPSEIAYGALWLLSDEASFVTGAELCVDGGLTAL